MPNLEDREKCHQNACEYCKHCELVTFDYCTGSHDALFCLVGLSEDDREHVKDELFLKGYHYPTNGQSERFAKILGLEKGQIIERDNPRYVNASDCCKYFEEGYDD